ncbi:hypothetical protein Pcinc_035137, partial [Petrolisthes cinctipes]
MEILFGSLSSVPLPFCVEVQLPISHCDPPAQPSPAPPWVDTLASIVLPPFFYIL